MMRDCLKDRKWFDEWTEFVESTIADDISTIAKPSRNPRYRPQFIRDLAFHHLKLILRRYSRGDPISELSKYLEPLLEYWEISERLGQEVWTPQQQHSRHSWAVNLDHYIDCFWLVGLALSLNIPEAQWQRLINLIGNEGEDALLDRIIATRSPGRRIGPSLCYPKPYGRLLEAIDAALGKQASLLQHFVEHWYKDVGAAARSGREKQAVPYKEPYWHRYHCIEGGYFGYWCIEAVAAVKAFGLDDSLCIGHPNYPGDLLHPEIVTAADVSRLLQELAATIGAPPIRPLTGEPQHLTRWEALKQIVKNKLG
ncbi:PoNi-like cognate immunity protein [Variovorax humicola]|uniref:PoNi-like cognate immunity protein n=1 Tax=Variovorax humicola TaxID=1769758 RepID=A0ABU8WBR7_9BURK